MSELWRKFWRDDRGATLIVAATTMPVLMLAVAIAVEISGVVYYRQRLMSAAELTCRQSALYLAQQAGRFNRSASGEVAKIREMANQNLIMMGLESEPYPLNINIVNDQVVIGLEGLKKRFAFNLAQLPAIAPKVSLECASLADPSGGTQTTAAIVADSFENHSRATDTTAETVAYRDWRSNHGFRIMGENSSAGAAADGRFSVKVDIGVNSILERDIQLDPGTYELVYSYKSTDADSADSGLLSVYGARPICGKPADVAWATAEGQTYGIAASIGPDTYRMQVLDVCIWSYGWVERRIQFRANQSFYVLRFEAIGRADGIGGLIDDVKICRVACE